VLAPLLDTPALQRLLLRSLGLPADRGTRLMHEIIPYYAQRPAGIP
jgi:hypothetical protein